MTTAAPARRSGWWALHAPSGRLLALAGSGLLLELVLLLGFLRPLQIRRHPTVVPTEQPLVTVLGADLGGALRFAVPVLCAFAAFAAALWLARGVAGRAALSLVLGGTVLFSLTLLPTNPVGAHDVYHNVADARTLWVYGDNPTVVPPNAHPDDPFFPHVPAWQDYPSVYGPLWYVLSGAPLPLAGDRLWPNVLGQKALTALFLLGTTALAMLTAARLRPGTAVAAGVLVGWNPLLQFETAGNAHNDVVMVCFALAALYALTRRWWPAVFPLLALAVAVKHVLVLLGPVLLVWLLCRRDVPRRRVALSLALGAVVGAAVYAPFLADADTLAGFRREADDFHITSSPGALLHTWLWMRLHLDLAQAATVMKVVLISPYLAAYVLLLRRIARNGDLTALVRTAFWALFLFLLVVKWWFWPWYLLWLAPVAALLPGSRPALLAVVFSATAMLMYVPYEWLLYEDRLLLHGAITATTFLLPALLALALCFVPERASVRAAGMTAATPAHRRGRRVMHALRSRLLALAGCGLLLELVLLLGFLRPLSLWRYPDIVPTADSLAVVLGMDAAGALRFALPVVCAFAAFGAALWLARGLAGQATAGMVLVGTVAFSLTLLPTNPVAGHDVYYHVANARTLWVYGDNPIVVPPLAHADDPFYPHLPAWQDFPSAYGPVWYMLSGAPLPFAGDRLWPNVLGLKALTALFLLGTTALAMLVARRLRPGAAAAAGVLVGWNPLLQFDTAGHAHFDVVVVFFVLAALYAVTRRWWVAVFPLLALSVATKYPLMVLGPVLLVWLLRRRDVPRRQMILSLVLGLLLGAALYAPFFAGMELLRSYRRQADLISSSPSAALNAFLWTRLHLSWGEAATIMKLVFIPPYLIAYALLLRRVPRQPSVAALVRAGFWAVFLLLTVATWWFWPWYLAFLVPLGALLPDSRPALVAAVFSATAMLMYVPHFWLLGQDRVVLDAGTALTAFLLPVLVALAPRLRRRAVHEPAAALAAD